MAATRVAILKIILANPSAAAFSQKEQPLSPSSGFAETLKNSAEAFAWACAGGFLLYKAVSGYMISNLSLSVACLRQRAASGKDYLVVTASLKKGDRGAVSLHEVIASVFGTDGKHETKRLSATRRLSSIKLGSDEVLRLKDSPARESRIPKMQLIRRAALARQWL